MCLSVDMCPFGCCVPDGLFSRLIIYSKYRTGQNYQQILWEECGGGGLMVWVLLRIFAAKTVGYDFTRA
jgi:hypothetical protein